ncbi:UPF0481 protein At3g47200-like [Ziziphus jujuba]|uniref:UPF0481 protein At3g47200-like n=1 Tax=Ziziphus jujuba TaxID=326968 RepID=A0ABM3IQW4_ZIZJJ|nr:UPF0481 protein At3g47200-like [Ziziphus jujuba]
MKEQSTAAAANEVAINIKNIDEDLAYIFNENRLSTRLSHQQLELPNIPKVPKMLRNLEKNKGCFDPHVVSIGPYHHGKDHLKEVEKLKAELARQYCGRFDGFRGYDLYEKVKVVAGEARGFYDIEPSKGVNDDQAFTKMMFLDGCFILQFMWLLVKGEYHAMGMKNNVIANVKRDMFLLENQLPYIVLRALMKDEKDEKCWKKRIETYITICRRLHPEVKPRWFSPFRSSPEEKYILHLLDMTRERFVNQSATIQCRKTQISDTNQIRSCSNEWYSYYSARVLNSMGIWFKPNKTGSFSDVKFESQLFIKGVLTLPPILIDASTKSVLLNLLAFESSHNNSADEQGVTSYMCFMDSIIDNAEDVMILRTQNVIVNCLGTDQQVADLFNDIASNLVPNPHTYAEAKRGIQKHCNNKLKKWMAEFIHIHFKNPWTLIALFGSLLLITLTAVQTYFAVKPS